jgi:hypothetical protein
MQPFDGEVRVLAGAAATSDGAAVAVCAGYYQTRHQQPRLGGAIKLDILVDRGLTSTN